MVSVVNVGKITVDETKLLEVIEARCNKNTEPGELTDEEYTFPVQYQTIERWISLPTSRAKFTLEDNGKGNKNTIPAS